MSSLGVRLLLASSSPEAIDTAKKPFYAQEAFSTCPHLPHPTRNTSSKMAITLLLNEPSWCTWFCVQRCVRINVPANETRQCLTENDLCTQAAPAVSLTSAFPVPLLGMFAHGVSDWWVDALHSQVFPWNVYACASSHRFFLQLWVENFFNHKDLTMDIFVESTL